MAMLSLPELKELRNRAEVNQNQSVEKQDAQTQTETTPTIRTINELLEKYKNDIENEKKKIGENAKDAYTMYDMLITLFPMFTYCKCTGEIAINGAELVGSNLYEILQFLSTNSPKKPPNGSAQILELLSQSYCPSTLFPNPVIRQIFRKYRHNHFKE